jgi:hypothetical protein
VTGTEADAEPTINLSIPELSNEEYHAQWRELEKQFPSPSWEDVKLEWKWIYESSAANTFDPTGKYAGYSVAVYQQRVVGVDINWLRLVVTMSRKFQVHPERIVVRGCPEF